MPASPNEGGAPDIVAEYYPKPLASARFLHKTLVTALGEEYHAERERRYSMRGSAASVRNTYTYVYVYVYVFAPHSSSSSFIQLVVVLVLVFDGVQRRVPRGEGETLRDARVGCLGKEQLPG